MKTFRELVQEGIEVGDIVIGKRGEYKGKKGVVLQNASGFLNYIGSLSQSELSSFISKSGSKTEPRNMEKNIVVKLMKAPEKEYITSPADWKKTGKNVGRTK